MKPKGIEILSEKEGIIKELKKSKTNMDFDYLVMSYGLLKTLINLRFFYDGDDLVEMNNALIKIHEALMRWKNETKRNNL